MRLRWYRVQLLAVLAFLAFLAFLAAAATRSGVGVAHAAAEHPATGMVCVRIVNAAAGASNVDVYFNSRTKPTPPDFAFGTVSDYWPEAGGTQTVYVTSKGQPKSAAFFTTVVPTPAGAYYTLALLGDKSSSLSIAVFKDDPSIASSNARVRVYHLSPDADVASVSVGSQTVIPNLGYQQQSDYLTVKSGTYTFNVSVQQGTKTVPLQATLEPNHVTSIFAVGKVNATGADAFKFVVSTTGAMPADWPQTGFDPHPHPMQSQLTAREFAFPIVASLGMLLLWLVFAWRHSRGRHVMHLRRRKQS